jgi:hypothetical protein
LALVAVMVTLLILVVVLSLVSPASSLPVSSNKLYQSNHIKHASKENAMDGIHLTIGKLVLLNTFFRTLPVG